MKILFSLFLLVSATSAWAESSWKVRNLELIKRVERVLILSDVENHASDHSVLLAVLPAGSQNLDRNWRLAQVSENMGLQILDSPLVNGLATVKKSWHFLSADEIVTYNDTEFIKCNFSANTCSNLQVLKPFSSTKDVGFADQVFYHSATLASVGRIIVHVTENKGNIYERVYLNLQNMTIIRHDSTLLPAYTELLPTSWIQNRHAGFAGQDENANSYVVISNYIDDTFYSNWRLYKIDSTNKASKVAVGPTPEGYPDVSLKDIGNNRVVFLTSSNKLMTYDVTTGQTQSWDEPLSFLGWPISNLGQGTANFLYMSFRTPETGESCKSTVINLTSGDSYELGYLRQDQTWTDYPSCGKNDRILGLSPKGTIAVEQNPNVYDYLGMIDPSGFRFAPLNGKIFSIPLLPKSVKTYFAKVPATIPIRWASVFEEDFSSIFVGNSGAATAEYDLPADYQAAAFRMDPDAGGLIDKFLLKADQRLTFPSVAVAGGLGLKVLQISTNKALVFELLKENGREYRLWGLTL